MNRSERTQRLEQFAYRENMQFSETDSWSLFTYLEDFDLFQKGRRKKISNILFSSDVWMDTKLYVFDYEYRRGKGKNNRRKLYQQTVFFIQSKQLALPEFFMQPEHFFHKIGAYLGIEDIDFKEFPTFSNRYHLKSDDEERIRDLFEPSVTRFFTVEKDWCMEGIGFYLILYKRKRLFQDRSISNLISKGVQLCKLMQEDELGQL